MHISLDDQVASQLGGDCIRRSSGHPIEQFAPDFGDRIGSASRMRDGNRTVLDGDIPAFEPRPSADVEPDGSGVALERRLVASIVHLFEERFGTGSRA
jgi:hypothetical protein